MRAWLSAVWLPVVLGVFLLPVLSGRLTAVAPVFFGGLAALSGWAGWRAARRGCALRWSVLGGAVVLPTAIGVAVGLLQVARPELQGEADASLLIGLAAITLGYGVLGCIGGLIGRRRTGRAS